MDYHRRKAARPGSSYLRARQITLTYDPHAEILRADTPEAVTAVIGHAS